MRSAWIAWMVVACGPWLITGCGAADTTEDEDTSTVDEAAVAGSIDSDAEATTVHRMNTRRTNHGSRKLFRSDCLTRAARGWSKHMAATNDLEHSNLAARVTNFCGDNWTLVGENVGVGSSELGLWKAFLDSDPHRANIDNPKFDFVGVGIFDRDDGAVWETQMFARCVKKDGTRCGGAWDDPVQD